MHVHSMHCVRVCSYVCIHTIACLAQSDLYYDHSGFTVLLVGKKMDVDRFGRCSLLASKKMDVDRLGRCNVIYDCHDCLGRCPKANGGRYCPATRHGMNPATYHAEFERVRQKALAYGRRFAVEGQTDNKRKKEEPEGQNDNKRTKKQNDEDTKNED